MLPDKYKYLLKEDAPRILVTALKYYGLKEIVGKEHNSTILGWAKGLGGWISSFYTNDEIPWCGLFMAHVCKEAGLPVVKDALRAKAWDSWGTRPIAAELGDILIFTREQGGHVGIYVGEDKTHYHVLGGNQSNSVSITRIEKSRLYDIRRTKWLIAQPANVRRIMLTATGSVSENEA